MDQVSVEVLPPEQIEAEVLAIAVPENDEAAALANAVGPVDAELTDRLGRLVEQGDVKGELGKTVIVHTDGDRKTRRVASTGVGPVDRVDTDALRTAAAAVARATADVGGTIGWVLDETLPISPAEQARAVVEGIVLGAYRPGRWKTD